jgi:hypothetical protein
MILQEFREFLILGENPKLQMKIAKLMDTSDQCCQMEFFLHISVRNPADGNSPYEITLYTWETRHQDRGGRGGGMRSNTYGLSAENTCQEKKIKP